MRFLPFYLRPLGREPEKPFRAEILSRDALAARALEVAECYSVVFRRLRGVKLQARFKENCKILNAAYFAFSEAAHNKEVLTAGAEWLLDNYHVIDEQVRDIRRDLPRGYYRALPKISDPQWLGFPRVYQLVCDFLAHTDATADPDSLAVYILAYQSKSILRIGEIWAIPIMLRLALVENLRRLALASLKMREYRLQAEKFCRDAIDSIPGAGADLLPSLVQQLSENTEVLDHGAVHIMRRLRARGASAALAMQWLDQKLREKGLEPNEIARIEQQAQAADQISVGNCVTSLKLVTSLNWREWFERVSHVDKVLSRDPIGVYTQSDFVTRDIYRHKIEQLARWAKREEVEIAEEIVQFAAEQAAKARNEGELDPRYGHIGYYLIDDGVLGFRRSLGVAPGLPRRALMWMGRRLVWIYLGAILALTILGLHIAIQFGLAHGASVLWCCLAALLFFLPLTEFSIHVVQWLVTRVVPPLPLPKLDLDHGVPDSLRTIVTVQTILADQESLEKSVESLEIRYLGNQDKNVLFALLADLPDAPTEALSGDRGLILQATYLISELNQRYCVEQEPLFYVLFRRRHWNPAEHKFMAWERKRGKIMEFNRLLRGANDTSFNAIVGDRERLKTVRFVITLDNDTQLPPGSAAKLIGAIAHPLNRPIFDEQTNVVKKGYGIIQPRVGITLNSGTASCFARIFSGHAGLDPYTRTVSDVYQDLFHEGSYIGKGVYDVDAFERALHNRVPENSLLSHDLFEGLFARTGLASDIELFDEYPVRYHAQARRQHRWIRGDWQLLPWIGRYIPDRHGQKSRTPISVLGRWKLIDNLRRSLVPAGLFLSLLLLIAQCPGPVLPWLIGTALVVGFPAYSVIMGGALSPPFGYSFTAFAWGIWYDMLKQIQLILLQLVLLPHQAFISCHAIGITLHRVFISRCQLLEWETAHAAERRLSGDLRSFVTSMAAVWPVAVAANVLVLLVGWPINTYWRSLAGVIFAAWYGSPLIAWWISRPVKRAIHRLTRSEQIYLRDVAFSTWRYFNSFLRPEYNFLIPDNLQVVPRRVIAERTSPTNVSLSLLSVISAYDLGFIPLTGVMQRLTNVFLTLSRLERFHGHFLNWYEIRSLRALSPRYVSTVDSGNLAGHLIAVHEALASFLHAPLVSRVHVEHICNLLEGIHVLSPGALAALRHTTIAPYNLASFLTVMRSLEVLRSDLLAAGSFDELVPLVDEFYELQKLVDWSKYLDLLKSLGERELLPKKLKSVDRILRGRVPTLALLLKITNRLMKVEQVLDASQLEPKERELFQQFTTALREAYERMLALSREVNSLQSQIVRIVQEIDFKFLFDPSKKLMVIGYNVDTGRRDNSYYDLLASECRLGSLVAIAKGDVPQSHWFLLSRALTDASGGKALLSWSATMFEYLMPLLVMRDFEGTILSETYRSVVRTQRHYARRRSVPWGMSESAYSGVDFERTYQYRAFGVPGLGLKRGLGDDVVVSPYSTVLALPIDPRHAVSNLRRLERMGLRGEFGFYEAVDFTKERLGKDETMHIVKSFLAHHQGMSLVSINNCLNNNIFRQRFHSYPAVRAHELLLQERFPTRIPIIYPHQAELSQLGLDEGEGRVERSERFRSPHTRYPRQWLLSNGRFTLACDNGGGNCLLLESDLTLTRWREDALINNTGCWLYVRDLKSRRFWSATYQPTRVEPEDYEVIFNPDKVEYRRRDMGIALNAELTVSPEDNVQVTRVTVTNLSGRMRELELTSFGEVALAPYRADLRHPAFSKLFIESEFLEDYDALLFSRRSRTPQEQSVVLIHLISMPVVWEPTQFETDRAAFIGRGRGAIAPRALQGVSKLSCRQGTVLDPIFSLRSRVELASGESQSVHFVTGVAQNREEAIQLVKRYRETQSIMRAFEMAWSHSDVEIRNQQYSIARLHAFQRLANAIIFNMKDQRAPNEIIRRNRLSQSGLWRFGLSGDEPIVLVTLTDADQIKLAEEVILAHEYLRARGLRFDLVLLNEYPGGYLQNLQEELEVMIKSGYSRDLVDKRGGIFLRNVTQLSEEEVILLYAVARIVLQGNRGSLSSQLSFDWKLEPGLVRKRTPKRDEQMAFSPPEEALEFKNDIGGFAENGRSYEMVVSANQLPPQPWSNVIANREFGFLITESGAGFTWAENSSENRITPWSNDPVVDPFGEVVYVRDQESGSYWCPTPRPVQHGQPVKVKHGFGYSEFSTQVQQVFSKLTVSGSTDEKVKWWHLELVNGDFRERKLEVFLYLDLVLGSFRESSYRFIQTGFDSEAQMLYATNPFNIDFSSQVVFCGSNHTIHSYTSSRREFFGRHGDLSSPAALEQPNLPAALGTIFVGGRATPVRFSGLTGGGFDPCAALKVQVVLGPGERHHVLFFLGQANSMEQAKSQAVKYRSLRSCSQDLEQVKRFWNSLTDAVRVRTPSRSFDILVNGWLLYQTYSARMLARTGFYQSSGAFGFRDQLQDSLALLYSRPSETRQQILLHASRQFLEGDVQHWWHPPSGRGIRTRISDNYLWLPFAVCTYVSATGDREILDERVKFLEAPLLEPGEMESYNTPKVSSQSATLYEHCVMAVDRALVFGERGLPLIGGGDWNDGFNFVGAKGQGESVWLGWFLATILPRFAELVESRGDKYRAEEYRVCARRLVEAIESRAWDGEWYQRAFFDDGSPLGSSHNAEARVDSVAQSWSVICGQGSSARQRLALSCAYRELVRPKDQLICLLWPPFQSSEPSPGYIQGYPPGIRENGGQYTHAAAWMVLAHALLGEGDKAFELFDLINPINHTVDGKVLQRYQTEPYVLCGDVYSVAPHEGRGGWSWYTGSSGWLYRVAVEHIVGLRVRGDHFIVDPCIPASWAFFECEFVFADSTFQIRIENPDSVQRGVKRLELNSVEMPSQQVPLNPPARLSGANSVVVVMGA